MIPSKWLKAELVRKYCLCAFKPKPDIDFCINTCNHMKESLKRKWLKDRIRK